VLETVQSVTRNTEQAMSSPGHLELTAIIGADATQGSFVLEATTLIDTHLRLRIPINQINQLILLAALGVEKNLSSPDVAPIGITSANIDRDDWTRMKVLTFTLLGGGLLRFALPSTMLEHLSEQIAKAQCESE